MSGRKRIVTDEQLAKLREWKPLSQLAKEMGLHPSTARHARNRHYKTASP